RLTNHLRNAVRGYCHLPHAQHIIKAETALTGKRAETIYRALLKFVHLLKANSDAEKAAIRNQIGKCFFPPIPIVRADGYWALANDCATPAAEKGLDKLIVAMPATGY